MGLIYKITSQMSSEVEITFLGTASAQPSQTRNMSSLCLRMDGSVWMFDCGEGTQHQLRASNLKIGKIEAIFITHNHGDHLFGLPGLLCTLSGSVDSEEERVIDIFGLRGVRMYLRSALFNSYSYLNFRLRIHELLFNGEVPSCMQPGSLECELLGSDIYPSSDGIWELPIDSKTVESVVAGELKHTVPSVGFVVTEKDFPGSLDAKAVTPMLMKHKAEFAKLGIKQPMALMKDLKEGKVVKLPDGTTINPSDVVGPSKPGRKIVILGDTSNSDSLLQAAAGCDLLVHEATNAKTKDETKSVEEVERTAVEHGHSTPQMAGIFARKVQAKQLLLNHFSARYKGDQSEESRAVMKEIEDLAKGAFGSDQVIATYDHFSLLLPKP